MLTRCANCNSDAVMPKSGLCLICGAMGEQSSRHAVLTTEKSAAGSDVQKKTLLINCSQCHAVAVMPKSGLCLVCGHLKTQGDDLEELDAKAFGDERTGSGSSLHTEEFVSVLDTDRQQDVARKRCIYCHRVSVLPKSGLCLRCKRINNVDLKDEQATATTNNEAFQHRLDADEKESAPDEVSVNKPEETPLSFDGWAAEQFLFPAVNAGFQQAWLAIPNGHALQPSFLMAQNRLLTSFSIAALVRPPRVVDHKNPCALDDGVCAGTLLAEAAMTDLDAGSEQLQSTLIDVFNDVEFKLEESPSTEESMTNLAASDNQQLDFLLDLGKSIWSDLNLLKTIIESFISINQVPVKSASTNNHRVATRFIREDIACAINIEGIFGFGKTIAVDLKDITSKGVLISSAQTLGINKKVRLTLQFDTGKVFVIDARIVRHADSSHNEYGIKFDRYNNELGDYLLETQEKLIFK